MSLKRLDRVKKSLDRWENGGHPELSLEACTEYIGWLYQFKKLPLDEIRELAEQCARIYDERRGTW